MLVNSRIVITVFSSLTPEGLNFIFFEIPGHISVTKICILNSRIISRYLSEISVGKIE